MQSRATISPIPDRQPHDERDEPIPYTPGQFTPGLVVERLTIYDLTEAERKAFGFA